MQEEETELINRNEKSKKICHNYYAVRCLPHIKTKLKKIDNAWLFDKESNLLQVMYKVHKELDGAKNLYFYIQKKNGQFGLLKPEMKLSNTFKRFAENGELKIFYHNDHLGKNKVLDGCFVFAQLIVLVYILLFLYGYFYSTQEQ